MRRPSNKVQDSAETKKRSTQTARDIEEIAIQIRERAGIGQSEPMDVFGLAGQFGAMITVLDLTVLPLSDRESLNAMDARTWSGAGIEMPDGHLQIFLNPNQTQERMNVTVLEEIAHSHLGHSPSTLQAIGLSGRSYDQEQEMEAYAVAAATLLPSRVVAQAVWRETPALETALHFGASVELFEFRVKRLNLWSRYLRHDTAA